MNEMGNIKHSVSVKKCIIYHHNLKQALIKYTGTCIIAWQSVPCIFIRFS